MTHIWMDAWWRLWREIFWYNVTIGNSWTKYQVSKIDTDDRQQTALWWGGAYFENISTNHQHTKRPLNNMWFFWKISTWTCYLNKITDCKQHFLCLHIYIYYILKSIYNNINFLYISCVKYIWMNEDVDVCVCVKCLCIQYNTHLCSGVQSKFLHIFSTTYYIVLRLKPI